MLHNPHTALGRRFLLRQFELMASDFRPSDVDDTADGEDENECVGV